MLRPNTAPALHFGRSVSSLASAYVRDERRDSHFHPGQAEQRQPLATGEVQEGSQNEPAQVASSTNLSTYYEGLRHPSLSFPRPYTAPTTQHDKDLSLLDPPRRQLPFDSTGAMPKPTVFTDEDRSAETVAEPKGAQPVVQKKGRAKRPLANSRLNGGRKPLGEVNDTNQISNTATTQTHLPQSTASKRKRSAKDASSEQAEVVVCRDSVAGTSDWLHSYAQQPTEKRQEELDGLITSCLEDESFAVFCEDVQNTWRRIGFGA